MTYDSPQIIANFKQTEKLKIDFERADIFSLGMVLLKMALCLNDSDIIDINARDKEI